MENIEALLKERRELNARNAEITRIFSSIDEKEIIKYAKFKRGDCFLGVDPDDCHCIVRKITYVHFYPYSDDIEYDFDRLFSWEYEHRLVEGDEARKRNEFVWTRITKEEYDSFVPYFDMGYFKKDGKYLIPLYSGEWKTFNAIKEAREYIKINVK